MEQNFTLGGGGDRTEQGIWGGANNIKNIETY